MDIVENELNAVSVRHRNACIRCARWRSRSAQISIPHREYRFAISSTTIIMIFNCLLQIIFFTTLYYLLQSSQNRYAPTAITINNSWGPRIIQALEDSISSVVVATLKLALFHGLFTWLTHTIVGAHIVYLPAVLASILAAAPFLETYWCSVPAFLDLWLSQDRFWLGAILVLIHFIVPSNFNPIIHSEIKGYMLGSTRMPPNDNESIRFSGGHPYLTGLSIAGGMYLFGLEGALLGPLLLCVLVVLFEVTMSAIRDSPITPQTR